MGPSQPTESRASLLFAGPTFKGALLLGRTRRQASVSSLPMTLVHRDVRIECCANFGACIPEPPFVVKTKRVAGAPCPWRLPKPCLARAPHVRSLRSSCPGELDLLAWLEHATCAK